MLGVQGARGRRACVGRAGVAHRWHGRWAARAQARGALERAGALEQVGRARTERSRRSGQARARQVSGTVAATRPHWPATRPAPCHDTAGDTATTRQPCARLGAPVHTWACLLGLLGACASGLAFWTDFRTDDFFRVTVGPGS